MTFPFLKVTKFPNDVLFFHRISLQSGCCTLVVVEERPPHMIVKRFGCTTIHKKRYINASFIHSSFIIDTGNFTVPVYRASLVASGLACIHYLNNEHRGLQCNQFYRLLHVVILSRFFPVEANVLEILPIGLLPHWRKRWIDISLMSVRQVVYTLSYPSFQSWQLSEDAACANSFNSLNIISYVKNASVCAI